MALAIELLPPGTRDPGGALTADEWRSDAFDFWAFDRRVDELHARGASLFVLASGEHALAVREQIAIRTQRLAGRRNVHSDSSWFTRVLGTHRALHDVTKPLVRADFDHALDTWQWTLRLDPNASAAVQLAALLHDIERLGSEPDVRIEQHARDYQAFKDAHARGGADLARGILERSGVPSAICRATCELVAVHERAHGSGARRAVSDADALSFFSLNSPGYLAYFGPEQTASKVAYTHARMSPRARRWLASLRVPEAVLRHLPATRS